EFHFSGELLGPVTIIHGNMNLPDAVKEEIVGDGTNGLTMTGGSVTSVTANPTAGTLTLDSDMYQKEDSTTATISANLFLTPGAPTIFTSRGTAPVDLDIQ